MPFEPVPQTTIGELQARFDIVLGLTPGGVTPAVAPAARGGVQLILGIPWDDLPRLDPHPDGLGRALVKPS